MKETIETLTTLRHMLTVSAAMAERVELHALVFLIGMAELEAAQAEVKAKREAHTQR